MNNQYSDTFEKLKALHDPCVSQIISNVEQDLIAPIFPQLLLIAPPPSRNEIVKTLGNFVEFPDYFIDDLQKVDNNLIVSLKYGKQWDERRSDDGDFAMWEISVPWISLTGMSILWICTSSTANIPKHHIIHSDRIVLITNASMAMTQEEKSWLKGIRQTFFSDEPITVSLYSRHSLNTKADADDLSKALSKLVAGFGENTWFVDNVSEALRIQLNGIDLEDLSNKRKKRILLSCIEELENYVRGQLTLSDIDIDRLNEAVRKVEEKRKEIALAGKLILISTIENMYGEMKNKLISAADRYSDDAYESIRSRIVVTKTIEQDINRIAPYLKSVWANFEKEIGKYVASEQEQIASILERQISSDCKKMVDLLDADSFDNMISISTASSLPDITFGAIDESTSRRNKMVSKGMLIASIALAFANPLWGLAGIAGTSAFNLYKNNNLEEAREKVLLALPSECNAIKHSVEKQIEAAIERAKADSCENVWQVYSEVLDNLMKSIMQYTDQIKAAKEKVCIFQGVLGTELQELKNRTN